MMTSLRPPALGLALLLGLTGCGVLNGSRNSGNISPAIAGAPTAKALVDLINRNADKVDALEATDLALEVKQGSQGGGLSGALFCQKPRNFRLRAKAIGKPVADFGSNDSEFWYWISEDRPPYMYHCAYADLAKGNVNLPFPFQPDWVLETLGMATLSAPIENFRIERKADKYELVERATSLSGRPVWKVTVFEGGNASGSKPQIAQHRLHDEKGVPVAIAEVLSVRRDTATGAVVPQHVRLKWPQQKIEMEMKLDGLKVYQGSVLSQRAPELFVRQPIRDVQAFDLARQSVDASLQRVGGSGPR